MAAAPVIITCGDNKPDATAVNGAIQPDYDGKTLVISLLIILKLTRSCAVLYSSFDLPATLQEVPLILSGNPPPADTLHTQIGANDFTNPPVAVVVGGGYNDEAYTALYSAILNACGASKKDIGVVFFRASNEITEDLVKEGKHAPRGSREYPVGILMRLKSKLRELGIAADVEGGVKEANVGELFWY